MRTTLKDVAKEAGISFTLVSKYLSHNPDARMRQETKRRIDEAVKKLNYRPSAIAPRKSRDNFRMSSRSRIAHTLAGAWR